MTILLAFSPHQDDTGAVELACQLARSNNDSVHAVTVVPQAWPTVVTVFITVLIGVMKVFDIVYAMTNGNYNTNVLGNAFYAALFRGGDPGLASAIVVILIIAIIPVLVYQVRQFRLQEANS